MSSDTPRTRHGIFILLRRLRVPLAALICAYAVAVLGFTLIPSVDPSGQPWTMSFLHAFYFVSFLGTTIGLGEIPYPFSDLQRLWATVSIYGTVLAWLYFIGALFSVLQAPLFRRIVHENRVERQVERLKEPFYLVCGYGDAGTRVARELAEDGVALVVIDQDQAQVDAADVVDLPVAVPALLGDAGDPRTLVLAGLKSEYCAGVLALTGNDQVNIKIALTARLLNEEVEVLCAAHDHAAHARMAAVGSDAIINPFDTFAERVAISLRTPSLHVIYESLTTQSGTAMDEPQKLPRGRWILCGSGLFTKTLRRQLKRLRIETTEIDPDFDKTEHGRTGVRGDPTDPEVLRQAGIDEATTLIAGTAEDIDNLTIVLAARSLNKNLFIIARQTHRRNTPVFKASPADLVTLSGYVIAAEVLRVIRAPQLANFLRRARDEDEEWAAALLERMREAIGEAVVESWSMECTLRGAPAVWSALARGETVTLRRVMARADSSGDPVRAIPLLLQRGSKRRLQPSLDTELVAWDRVLFCGSARARATVRHSVQAHALPAEVSASAAQEARETTA